MVYDGRPREPALSDAEVLAKRSSAAAALLSKAGFKCGNIDPAARSMTLQRSFEDGHLAQSIDELRVLRSAARFAD